MCCAMRGELYRSDRSNVFNLDAPNSRYLANNEQTVDQVALMDRSKTQIGDVNSPLFSWALYR